MSSIKALINLQECDTQIIRSKKELDELPEVQAIMECRAKRKEIKGKQDQVVELAEENENKIAKLQAEEEQVVQKLKDLQSTLDSSSDYRVTSSVTRDMEGQVKRQANIAKELDELLERQIKIDNLADQVADMLQKLNHNEQHHTESFKEKGGAIRDRIASLESERETLLAQIEPDIAHRYEALREEKNGIGLSRLEEDHCSICRSIILTGELSKLLKGPALSECPSCHRLMIVREEE